jgi:hypothetical protein
MSNLFSYADQMPLKLLRVLVMNDHLEGDIRHYRKLENLHVWKQDIKSRSRRFYKGVETSIDGKRFECICLQLAHPDVLGISAPRTVSSFTGHCCPTHGVSAVSLCEILHLSPVPHVNSLTKRIKIISVSRVTVTKTRIRIGYWIYWILTRRNYK